MTRRLICASLALALAAGAYADTAPTSSANPALLVLGSMDPALQVQYTSHGSMAGGSAAAAGAAGGPLVGLAGYVIGTMVGAHVVDNMASGPQEQRIAPIRQFYADNDVVKLVADAVSSDTTAAATPLEVQTRTHDAGSAAERAASQAQGSRQVLALEQQTFVSESLQCLKTEFSYRLWNQAPASRYSGDDDSSDDDSRPAVRADTPPRISIYFDYHEPAGQVAATAASGEVLASAASGQAAAIAASAQADAAAASGKPAATVASGTENADTTPAGWASAPPASLKDVFAESGKIVATLLPRLLHNDSQQAADYVIATTGSHEKIRGYQLPGIGDWVVMRDDNANYFVLKPIRLSVLRKVVPLAQASATGTH